MDETTAQPISNTADGDQYNAGRDLFMGNQSVSITNIEAERAYDVHGLPNPYLGLKSFTYANRDIFAGRDGEVADARDNLTNPLPLLFITGASGAGKSSFAQAGLLPVLEEHYKERGLSVVHVVIRPGDSPQAALVDALQQLKLSQGVLLDEAQFAADADIWQFLLDHTHSAQINIIIIDQFEELFTLTTPEQCRDILAPALNPALCYHQSTAARLLPPYVSPLCYRPPAAALLPHLSCHAPCPAAPSPLPSASLPSAAHPPCLLLRIVLQYS